MRRLAPCLGPVALLVALLTGLAPAFAEPREQSLRDGSVRVRVSTDPEGRAVIGQQTRLFVEILTDTWFTQAPAYPEFDLDGAIVLQPEQLGTNFTERIGGTTFAAQRRSYVVFPQRAGALALPSLRITLAVAEDGRPGEPFDVTTPALRLDVVIPPEAEGIDGLVTTPRLDVRDQWSRELEGLEVGDAVKRTVNLSAEKALGMLLPDLDFEAPEGIATYADQPRVGDRTNRGQYRGERVEQVTYVLERPGEYVLPAIELHWWDPEADRLVTEQLEERRFEVAPSSRVAAGDSGEPASERLRVLAAGLVAFVREHLALLLVAVVCGVALVQGLRRLVPLGLRSLGDARERRRHSEATAFRALERSVREGDPATLVRTYWAWRGRLQAERPHAKTSFEAHARASGFEARWARFEAGRYGSTEGGAGLPEGLLASLRALRTGIRKTPEAARTPGFGTLNPLR